MAWALHVGLYTRLLPRFNSNTLFLIGGLLSAGAGIYTGLVLAFPEELNVMLSPAIGAMVAVGAVWVLYRGYRRIFESAGLVPFFAVATIVAVALGTYCGLLVANAPGSRLYLSWGVSCLLAGAVGLALYRGLYVHMRQRARSPLIMLVASLGILLAFTAFTSIVFQERPTPSAGGLRQ